MNGLPSQAVPSTDGCVVRRRAVVRRAVSTAPTEVSRDLARGCCRVSRGCNARFGTGWRREGGLETKFEDLDGQRVGEPGPSSHVDGANSGSWVGRWSLLRRTGPSAMKASNVCTFKHLDDGAQSTVGVVTSQGCHMSCLAPLIGLEQVTSRRSSMLWPFCGGGLEGSRGHGWQPGGTMPPDRLRGARHAHQP